MTTVDDRTPAAQQVPVVAALFVPPANVEFLMTSVWSLGSAGIPVVAGGPSWEMLAAFREVGCGCLEAANAADLINQAWVLHHLPVLAVVDAVSLPDNFLGRALQLMADDLRVATVSFLSNDAGFLSFPLRNEPTNEPPPGQDATSVSRALRELGPHDPPTPVPTAIGAAVLLAPSALGAVGGFISGPRGLSWRACWRISLSGRGQEGSSTSSTTRLTSFVTDRLATLRTGLARTTTSILKSAIGSTRAIPTRWHLSITKRDPLPPLLP